MKEESFKDQNEESGGVKKSNVVNLLDFAEVNIATEFPLEIVKLGTDETAVVAFTLDGEAGEVHYCVESEINGYVHCNGPDCVLCRIGKKKVSKIFLPVYLPLWDKIGILPLNKSMSPTALLPKIINIARSQNRMVMFITRESYTYRVSSKELTEDSGGDMSAISRFNEEYTAGKHAIKAIYPTINNVELADFDEISRMLKLKGAA